jgi:FemAB-related protein (PEP-CTERM system-associated)
LSAETPVRVRVAAPDDLPAWGSFVAGSSCAEAGHRWAFHDLLDRVFGLEVIRLVALREDRWVGVLPLVYQRSLVGRFLTSVPYLNYAGVLSGDAEARGVLAEEALAIAGDRRADRLELRGRDGSDLPLETWGGKCSYRLELPPATETLWESLGAKLRSQVKRPRKEGFTVRVVANDSQNAFYTLLARRWHALGSPVLPRAFFEQLAAVFSNELDFVLVEREGRTAAAGVLLHVADRVEVPWAASAPEHDRFGVNMLLYWASIERAIERGANSFDLGRSTPGTGNARFKEQWGAVEQPLRWNVHVRGERGRAGERGDRRRNVVASTWRHLPGFIVNRLGPVLAARIPY